MEVGFFVGQDRPQYDGSHLPQYHLPELSRLTPGGYPVQQDRRGRQDQQNCIFLPFLFYCICPIVGANCQKNNRVIREILAETVFTLRDMATFFANHENNPKIAVNADASTPAQIQFSANIAEEFRVIWRG